MDCLAPCIERNIALYLPLHKTTPLTFVFFLFCLFPSSSIRVLYSKDSPLHICFRLWLNAYIFFCNPFPSTPRFFPSFFFFFFSFHQGFRSLSPLVGFQFLMASWGAFIGCWQQKGDDNMRAVSCWARGQISSPFSHWSVFIVSFVWFFTIFHQVYCYLIQSLPNYICSIAIISTPVSNRPPPTGEEGGVPFRLHDKRPFSQFFLTSRQW